MTRYHLKIKPAKTTFLASHKKAHNFFSGFSASAVKFGVVYFVPMYSHQIKPCILA